MEFTATETTEGTSGEEKINSLLGGDSARQDPPSNGTERVAEDTSVADADYAPDQEDTEHVDTTGGDGSEEEHPDGEDKAGEGEFELTERDADFSTDAYARAAAHYAKQSGKTLDPNDPGDRFILRELMERGQKIRELQSAEEDKPEVKAGAEDKAEEVKPAQPAKPTVEQIRARMKDASEYAAANIVPEVAMEFAKSFMDAMWPGKGVGEKISQEQATSIAKVFSTFAVMQIADAIPSILSAVPQAVVNGDPMFGRVRDMAVRESAYDAVTETRNKAGEAAYPDFDKLIENGEIKRQMNSEELKNAVFAKDPHANLVAKLKFAYRLAKNQPVDVNALERASERGREEERKHQGKVAAGKLPPGSSRGSFAEPGKANNFMNRLIAGSGSKFHDAIVASRK
jgi:hypothetical protein